MLPSHSGRLSRLLRWLMPNGGTLILSALFVFAQSVGALPLPARQSDSTWITAPTINYQGRLADSGGVPINDTVAMQFALYNASTGGTRLWGLESHPTVPVSDGLFSVGLGSQTTGGIPTNVLSSDVWLEITVDGETLSPREQLRVVPYAMQASVALTVPDDTITSAQIADNAVGSSEIADNAVGSGEIANGAVTQVEAPTLLQSANGNGQIIRYGTATIETDGNGEGTISFGYTFPNRVTSFVAMNGSIYGNGGHVIGSLNIDQYVVQSSVKIRTTTVNGTMKINWIAVGY